jgi:hypothetical protein
VIDHCSQDDFETIYTIINDAAEAYRGVIPNDRWHEPYMARDELRHEIDSGVRFWGYRVDKELVGVMGIQDAQDVTLIDSLRQACRTFAEEFASVTVFHLTLEDSPCVLANTPKCQHPYRVSGNVSPLGGKRAPQANEFRSRCGKRL